VFITGAANSVGGYLAQELPLQGGRNAQAMISGSEPCKAYLLLNVEPDLDVANPLTARAALDKAELVIALSPFKSAASAYADVLLPIAPFTETPGTFVNCEGRAQVFNSVVPPLAGTRPGWKVLRMLGSMLGLPGFDYGSIDAIRAESMTGGDIASRLANATNVPLETPAAPNGAALERIADVPLYFADPLVRRAVSLQKTRDARPPMARVNPSTLAQLKLAEGAAVRVRQD